MMIFFLLSKFMFLLCAVSEFCFIDLLHFQLIFDSRFQGPLITEDDKVAL